MGFSYLTRKRSDLLAEETFLGTAVDTGQQIFLPESSKNHHIYMCGITGSGKTKLLLHLLKQDLSRGQPFALVDPTGALFQQMVELVASGIERAERKGISRELLLPRYRFLNLGTQENQLRVNPLMPVEGETTEQTVDDVLRVVERLLGSIDQMRRVRNVFRSTLWIIVELNRLPAPRQPEVGGKFSFPLDLRFVPEFLALDASSRARLLQAMPDKPSNSYARHYWQSFFNRYSQSQQAERIESTHNILSYFVADECARSFFEVEESTLDIATLLREGASLICHLPTERSLKGSQLVGAFLTTKLQQAAYRRPLGERKNSYRLYIDEFPEFTDREFARASATLRQYGLQLVLAHQSMQQAPFDTAEGQALLNTIQANCRTKFFFRLHRPDAERAAKELLALSQRKLHFVSRQVTKGTSTQETHAEGSSIQQTSGRTENWSRSRTHGEALTATQTLGRTLGQSQGETLTKGTGGGETKGLAHGKSFSKSQGENEALSQTLGRSRTDGVSWSRQRQEQQGWSRTSGLTASQAQQRSGSLTASQSQQQGSTKGLSLGTQHGATAGNSLTEALPAVGGSPAAAAGGYLSSPAPTSRSQVQSEAQSHSEQRSEQTAQSQSAGLSVQQQRGETATLGQKFDRGISGGTSRGLSVGGSQQLGQSEQRGATQGRSRQLTRGESLTANESATASWQESAARSETQSQQFSRSVAQGRQVSRSLGETAGGAERRDFSRGQSETRSEALGRNRSETQVEHFYSLEGERELLVNALQALPTRLFYACLEPLQGVLVEAPFVGEGYYLARGEDLREVVVGLPPPREAGLRQARRGAEGAGAESEEREVASGEQESTQSSEHEEVGEVDEEEDGVWGF